MAVPTAKAPTRAITELDKPAWGDLVFTAQWPVYFLFWISLVPWLYLLSLAWTLVFPLASSGVVDLLDFQWNPNTIGHGSPDGTYFVMGWFIFSIVAGFRTQKSPLRYLLVLAGQVLYTGLIVYYYLQGNTPLIGLGVHGGLLLINLVAVLSIAGSRYNRLKYVKWFLMPATALTFVVIGIGILLGSRAIVGFAGAEHQEPIAVGLFFLYMGAAAIVCLNHIHPLLFFVSAVPHVLYTVTVATLTRQDQTTSLAAIFGNVALLISLFFVSMLQMQHYTTSQPTETRG